MDLATTPALMRQVVAGPARAIYPLHLRACSAHRASLLASHPLQYVELPLQSAHLKLLAGHSEYYRLLFLKREMGFAGQFLVVGDSFASQRCVCRAHQSTVAHPETRRNGQRDVPGWIFRRPCAQQLPLSHLLEW